MPLAQIAPVSNKDINDLKAALGVALVSSGRQFEATPLLEGLWKERKDLQTAYNLAVCYRQTGCREKSFSLSAFACQQDNSLASFLAEDVLYAGDWKRGWELYHNRYTKTAAAERFGVTRIPEWQGEQDAHLLVIGEGGLGDHVCFSRWMDRITCKWSLVVENDIRWFYERTKWKDHLKVPDPISHWTTTFSLPALGLPMPAPTVINHKVSTNDKVGLCWQAAEPLLHGKRVRSLTEEQALQLVKSLPHIQWVNLQYGWKAPKPIENPPIDSFKQFLAVVAGLAAVVSVDTFPMHLAGTLNKRLIVLLGSYCDWKFGNFRHQWYPQAEFIHPEGLCDGFDKTIEMAIPYLDKKLSAL